MAIHEAEGQNVTVMNEVAYSLVTGGVNRDKDIRVYLLSVIQRRFSKVIVSNTDTAPTLENAMGAGGNNIPMVLLVLEDQGGGGD